MSQAATLELARVPGEPWGPSVASEAVSWTTSASGRNLSCFNSTVGGAVESIYGCEKAKGPQAVCENAKSVSAESRARMGHSLTRGVLAEGGTDILAARSKERAGPRRQIQRV